MTNLEYCNEILSIIGNVTEANDAIYKLAYDAYLKLGGQESQPSLATIYNELKGAIQIWDNTDSLNITENGTYNLLGKIITVNVQCGGSVPSGEIWYTSSDGNIVTPYQASSLPTIVSNTYVDGKGVIKFATDVTSIGYYAFRECSGLTSIEIPNSVTSIGYSAFYKCSGLTSIEIPNNITRIEWETFRECSGLTSVVIPDSVTIIVDAAFSGCSSLTSIEIPNSVTSIGHNAFALCRGLTSIEIPNSVTSIGSSFYYCNHLTSVTIGNGITSIGANAFDNCYNLTTISYAGTIAQYNAITKGNNWHHSVPATVVHCTDGDAPI